MNDCREVSAHLRRTMLNWLVYSVNTTIRFLELALPIGIIGGVLWWLDWMGAGPMAPLMATLFAILFFVWIWLNGGNHKRWR